MYKVTSWSLAGTVVSLLFVIGSIRSRNSEDQSCVFKFHEEYIYTAAVVEYKPIPIGSQSPEEALLTNVQQYVEIISKAGVQKVDIIVFPEYGLTTIALPPHRDLAREFFVQLPEFGVSLCENEIFPRGKNWMVLHQISCAAKASQMYIVINLGEFETCDIYANQTCPSDGVYHYNTNVVFDRNGSITSRYRKNHLYFEPQFDYPPVEYATFQTDFGVEFGLFTCFDIIFAHPAVELVATRKIRNFVFPTAWIDELPFLTAIQAQSLWAQSNNVNLLASGYHQPERGSMGSGIYSGWKGALSYVFDSSSGTKLIISTVLSNPDQEGESTQETHFAPKLNISTTEQTELIQADNAPYHMWLREDLSNCTHKLIDPQANSDSLCHNDKLCCDLSYTISNPSTSSGTLRFLVFDGIRTVAAKRDWFEWQVCAVIHCLNNTLESCTENIISPNETSIHPRLTSIKIKARPLNIEYEQNNGAQPGLSLLDTKFALIPQSYFNIRQWKDVNNDTIVEAQSIDSRLQEIDIKTIALIHKVYGGR